MNNRLERQVLVLVTLGLVAFGLVMVFSATSASAALDGGNPMQSVIRQAIYAAGGIVGMVVLSRLDYHLLRPLAPVLLVGAFAACLAVLVLGPSINDARRWFVVGPVSLQPSEFAKLALLVWLAARLSRRKAPTTPGELMKPVGLVIMLFSVVILLEPDLGTTISLGLMAAAVLLVSGTPLRLMGLVGTVAVAGAVLAVYMEPYRKARMLAFLDPWQDARDGGYQIVQAFIAVGSGGVTGEGLGQGVQKANFLPEAHTDMIFAVIGEELGLVGVTIVLLAFATFAWAGLRVARGCRDPFGMRLAAGATALVCGQAAINMAAVLGIAPLTGIPLPFISAGGSSLLVLLGAVGIVLNIAGNERVVEARVRGRSRRDRRARATGTRSRGSASRPRSDGDVRRHSRPRRVAAGS